MKNANITPKEALKLVRYIPIYAARNAADVMTEHLLTYRLQNAKDEQERELIGNSLFMTIYNAGRIDGIRGERARRRTAG